MALGRATVLAATELDNHHLFAAAMAGNSGSDLAAFDIGLADLEVLAIGDHQDLVDSHAGAGFGVELFDLDFLALFYPVLLATGFDNRVHNMCSKYPRL